MRSLITALLLASTAASQATPRIDVERLVRESFVVDGNVNYYSPNSDIGQPCFERDENGRSVKAATGIDLVRGVKADGILDSPRRWFEVARRLADRGRDEAQLKKVLGLNFLRVYKRVLGRGRKATRR